MWEMKEGRLRRLRCEIGHGFTGEAFLDAKNDEVEQALSVAERTLNERAVMLQRLADDMREKDRPRSAEAFEERAQESREEARVIRRVMYGEE